LKVDLRVADIEQLELPPSGFDAIVGRYACFRGRLIRRSADRRYVSTDPPRRRDCPHSSLGHPHRCRYLRVNEWVLPSGEVEA
jgi:hypothetical protein